MIKIGELLIKLWSLRSCFPILPSGALAPQGIKGAVKRDVSKIVVPSSDVPAEVEFLHMRIERHVVSAIKMWKVGTTYRCLVKSGNNL